MSNFKQLSAPMTPQRLADLKQRRHGLSFFWSQQVGELIAAVEEKDKRIATLEREKEARVILDKRNADYLKRVLSEKKDISLTASKREKAVSNLSQMLEKSKDLCALGVGALSGSQENKDRCIREARELMQQIDEAIEANQP